MAFGAAAYAVGAPVRFTASGVIAGGTAMARTYTGTNANSVAETTALPGCIMGFFVNATSTGVISLATNNGGAAGTAFGANITVPAAGQFVTYPVLSQAGIYCTLVSGTCDLTFFVVE
jgi:hypothetical protein